LILVFHSSFTFHSISFIEHPESVAPHLKAIYKQWREGKVDIPIPGGESPVDVQTRAVKIIREILNKDDVENLLVICHGKLIRILLSSLLGMGLHNLFEISQHNTAVNIIHYNPNEDSFTPVVINYTEHLPEDCKTEIEVSLK
jgi:broad specificity phosphatase PhoE